jgi:membrane protease YdiL (CAAX protease family)
MNDRPLIAFFGLAFALSWAIEIPLALQARGVVDLGLPPATHHLASFGPLLAATMVVGRRAGAAGLAHLARGLVRWRIGARYAAFATCAPPLAFAVAAAAGAAFGDAPDLARLGEVDGLPPLGVAPALLLWLATFGVGEEVGWRGFALPRLQARTSAWRATLLLSLAWGLWHAPAFAYRPTYLAMGPAGLPAFLVSITAASVVFTWLYNASGGSLLAVAVFHALFDFFSVTPAGGEATPIVMTALVVGWAVTVARRYGPASLAPGPKVASSDNADRGAASSTASASGTQDRS